MSKSPKTIVACMADIIEGLRRSEANIERLKRTGEYEKYANLKMNPDGRGEYMLGCFATKRDWQAARELAASDEIVLVGGSLDGVTVQPGEHWPSAYLLTGPKFPKA